MAAVGERASGPGVIYLTGGATALLFGWRQATIDAAMFERVVREFCEPGDG